MKLQDEFDLMRSLYYPVEGSTRRQRPSTNTLFRAIAGEALACLHRCDWEYRVRNIERLVTVIRWRMNKHREDQHQSQVEKLVKRKNKEVKVI